MVNDRIDREIEKAIAKDLRDFKSIFTSEEEKNQIVERVAKLRASMNPTCAYEKKD